MWIWGEMASNYETIYGNTLYTKIFSSNKLTKMVKALTFNF